MRLKKVINILETKFPKSLKEDWDNVGLLVGDSETEIKKVQISLDVTDDVIENAIKNEVDLLITHHPLIFKAIKNINNSTKIGKKILKLIKNNINLYTLHTNIDAARGGLNDYLLKKLEIEESFIIEKRKASIYKFSVFIPEENFEDIRKKILDLNDYELGNYSKVSYSLNGEESFLPKLSAQPKMGELDKLSLNKIKKLEFLVSKNNMNYMLNEVKKIHPYEDVPYEIFKLENNINEDFGIGRYFDLDEKVNVNDYIDFVKTKLNLKKIRVVHNKESKKNVKRIAVVNGSGMSFFRNLKACKVDLFITGDVKYHEAMDALESKIIVLDIGHYESEHIFVDLIKESLPNDLEKITYNAEAVFKFY